MDSERANLTALWTLDPDYDRVVYTELDEAGGWKMSLIQELKVADFDVDVNRAFRT